MHLNQVCERGTETATFELATALHDAKQEVSIFYPAQAAIQMKSLELFRSSFDCFAYSSLDREKNWFKRNFDFAYLLKVDGKDGVLFPGIWNAIHVVFREFLPHGNSYTYVSEWLAEEMRVESRKRMRLLRRGFSAKLFGCYNSLRFDGVPHLLNMPNSQKDTSLQARFNTDDRFVIVRYGGYGEFDIPWVQSGLLTFLDSHPEVVFMAINTKKFSNHKQIIYLDRIYGNPTKAEYLQSANLFLHGRSLGETFGMSILEAMQMGTDVLAYRFGMDRNQNQLLQKSKYLYSDRDELLAKLEERLVRWKISGPTRDTKLMEYGNYYRPSVLLNRYMKILFDIHIPLIEKL